MGKMTEEQSEYVDEIMRKILPTNEWIYVEEKDVWIKFTNPMEEEDGK